MAQVKQLENFAGACRFLWNKLLRLNLDRLQQHQSILWYSESDYWSKLWKSSQEFSFLKQVPAHCLQQKMRDLSRAFKDAFDTKQPNKRIPVFRKKGLHDSFRFPEPKQIQIQNRRIKLPKLGWIGFFKSQDIEGEVRNVTVSKESGHWYIAIQVEQTLNNELERPTTAIGIDVGIAKFATLSDGTMIEPLHVFRRYEKRLAKSQKKLSIKRKYSNNWRKQQLRIQRIHSKIRRIRHDFLHKLTTKLSKNHAMIVIEDLKISNMSRSAKGGLDAPGKNVRAKSGLNKSILDQSWGEFRRQLTYKQDWCGGILLEVPARHTSQRCELCGHTEKANRLDQSHFECQSCGYKENADVNAARNILAAGHAVLACGETGLPASMKQEPLGKGNLVLT